MILLNLAFSFMSFIALFYQFISYRDMKLTKGLKFWAVVAVSLAIYTAAIMLLVSHGGIRHYGVGGCLVTIISVIRELRVKSESMTVSSFFGGLFINFFFWPQALSIILFSLVNRSALKASEEEKRLGGDLPPDDAEDVEE